MTENQHGVWRSTINVHARSIVRFIILKLEKKCLSDTITQCGPIKKFA